MTSTPTPTPTSTSSEMVERVARAICIEFGGDPDVAAVNARDVVTRQWQTFEVSARAAIKAMRMPTAAMLEDAGVMDGYEYDNTKSDEHHIDWWQAMIDAARSETPEAEG